MARLLRMPEVAANATVAVVSDWPVAENEPFREADAIATIETEKAVVDVPADADGVILRTLVQPGAEVEVGAPIALIGDRGEQVDDVDALLVELGAGERVAPVDAGAGSVDGAAVDGSVNGASSGDGVDGVDGVGPTEVHRVFSSPLARRLARDAGLRLDQLVGTGPGGRIVRRDVEAAVRQQPAGEAPAEPSTPADEPAPSAAAAGYADTPHSRVRRATAARLTESKQQAPHFYVRGTARVDRLLRLRERINAAGGVKVSVNDFVVKAVGAAHGLVPAMNVIWTAEAVRAFERVDVAVAVATERGLLTPVVRDVGSLSLSAVARTTADLATRAREGRLRQEELEGGTISVTNLGMYGTEEFTAIINPPHAAILAVGAARPEAVVRKGKLRAATVVHVTLSVDHRPVDGVVAAQWMRAFVELLENPERILV